MTPARFSRPSLSSDETARVFPAAVIAALDYARALVALESPGSDVTALEKAEAAFALACRDVFWAVQALPDADRPKGWRAET